MIAAVRWASGLAFEVFYRYRRPGAEVPARGPVILVANHPNGLVDAVALMLATPRPLRFLGKAPLFRMPVLGQVLRAMGALPVYRRIDGADTGENEGTFRAVFDALAAGGVVCLFPEGISHSEPALQVLKTGAARMALGALQAGEGACDVRVVPVGLLYGRKGRFRSRMAIWVGEPIEAREYAEVHQRDEREGVRTLTEAIADGLRRVTIQLESWQDWPLVEIAERIWPRGGGTKEARLRAFAEGLARLRRTDPEAARELELRVAEFRDRLDFLDLAPEDLETRYSPAGVVRFVLRTLGNLFVTLPLALLGGLVWYVPYRLTGWVSSLRRVEPDIVATQKLLAGLVLFPLWWIAASFLAGRELGLAGALVTASVTPLLGVLTLRWGDRFRSAWRDVTGFRRFSSAETLKARLRTRRDELIAAIESRQDAWRGDLEPDGDPMRR